MALVSQIYFLRVFCFVFFLRYFLLFDDSKMNIWLCWLGEMSCDGVSPFWSPFSICVMGCRC